MILNIFNDMHVTESETMDDTCGNLVVHNVESGTVITLLVDGDDEADPLYLNRMYDDRLYVVWDSSKVIPFVLQLRKLGRLPMDISSREVHEENYQFVQRIELPPQIELRWSSGWVW